MFESAAEDLVTSDFADACPIATLALEVASTDEDLRRTTESVFADWVDAGTLWFSQWVAPPADRQLATSLVMLLEGAFLLARASRDSHPLAAAGLTVVRLLNAARLAESPCQPQEAPAWRPASAPPRRG